MKNTPLAKIIGCSHEYLNVFHRWVGFVAWVQGAVHLVAIALATSRLIPNQLYILLDTENVLGIVAFGAWTIMMLAFPLLRRYG